MTHPTLQHALRRAAIQLRFARRAADMTGPGSAIGLAATAYRLAREHLLHALRIAKVLGLGGVVARVLLALREVAKARTALPV